MRDISAEMLSAIADNVVRPVWLCEAEFGDGVVRVWNGIGDMEWEDQSSPPDSPSSRTFTGLGDLLNVSTVSDSSDLKANGITVSLSGIPAYLLAEAIGQIEYGMPATVWLGFMDSTNTLIHDPMRAFSGYVDNAQIDESSDTASISLAAESKLITLRTPRVRRYTSEDQKIYYPTDLGFDFVPSLQQEEIRWGAG